MVKKKAIIVDIDGTLADVEHRVHFMHTEPKDWRSFNSNMLEDKLNIWCHQIMQAMKREGQEILLVTGRGEKRRLDTENWLHKHNVNYDGLFMRSHADRREDFLIKKIIYEERIAPNYDVLFVLEDRLSVVKMWRSIGLICLQCDWGDF